MSPTAVAVAILSGLLLVATTPVHSQSFAADRGDRPGDARGLAAARHPRFDCTLTPDPVNCEARRKEFHAQLINAQSACAQQRGEDHHRCMIQTMCLQERNPQQCEDIARRRAEHRQEIREACAGRTGDEQRDCVRSRMGYEPATLVPVPGNDE